jgi:DMSO/TMAO reductase YedYZ molybdopterin-dependent catalytic subunit
VTAHTATEPPAGRTWLAGAVATALALGVGELLAAVGSVASGSPTTLIGAVGDWFIDGAGAPLAAGAIATLGSASKPSVVVGIVVVCVALGAAVGRLAASRPWVATVVFAAAAVFAIAVGTTVAGSSPAAVVLAATGAAVAGWASLRWLTGIAAGRSALPVATTVTVAQPMTGDRRTFLGWAAATGVVAVVAGLAGRALGGPSAAEVARSSVALPAATTTPGVSRVGAVGTEFATPGITPVITDTRDFFRIDTALTLPQVDPTDWSLDVTGMVDRPYSLTYDELMALPMVEQVITLSCVSNPVGGSLVGTAVWQGVVLADVLQAAGVQAGADQLVGRSVDGFTVGFPTQAAFDGRAALVAVAMNGEPLPVRHGFPARLVVSGLFGYVSATKWLRQLELTTWDAFDAYWVPRGWSKTGPVRTQSRIDVPAGRTLATPGPTPVAGVAWAPNVGIERVEVQIDDGPWIEAELSEPLSEDTWRQWQVMWDATEGLHRLRVRATDRTGATQPETPRPVAPDGATGWHTRRITVGS